MAVSTGSEFRLFVSSTFQDLQAERAYLLKQVFPKVRAACRERGIEFTDIDLRWGLTEEEASQGRVIRTCLEEIERCSPYFISILGERYGWVPTLSEVQKDYQLIERYPWVEDAAIDGKSLVEIETMAGILNDPAKATGAFVYVRSSPEHDHQAELLPLIERLEASGRPVHSFDTLEAFGEQVYRDLLEVLDRDWPIKGAVTELDSERRLQQNFAATRRRAYIANVKQMQVLQDHVAGKIASVTPLVVHGRSGAGKSALMAYFAFHHQRTNPNSFVISHFVGASPSGSSAETILRHIALEIRDRIGFEGELPSSREGLEEMLPMWLGRVPGELVIIIDAVNQLPEPDHLLGWLPEHWPPNVHLLLTTTPGESLDRVRSLKWSELEIGPLTPDEREAIVVRFLGEYRKSLSQKQLDAIAHDAKASSPLFLRTLLEELRIAADFDLLVRTIDHYLHAQDLDELFQFVLERMEADYGADLVSSMLGFIAASRRGLSEPELMELTGVERTKLSVLLLALDYHLMKPNGRFTFFHDYLRRAVQRRYLANPLIERERHRKLALFFAKHTLMSRRFEEEPWQWKACGDKRRLAESLAKLDLLTYASDNNRVYEVSLYWGETDRDAEPYYEAALEQLRNNRQQYVSSALTVNEFLQMQGKYDAAERLLREALLAIDPLSPLLGKALVALGTLQQTRGKLDDAEQLLRRAVGLEDAGDDQKQLAVALQSLAGVLYLKAEHLEAVKLLQRARALGNHDIEHATDYALDLTLSATLSELGRNEEAEELLREALRKCERTEGRTLSYAIIVNNLGAVLYRKSSLTEASALFKTAIEINRKLLGVRHPQTVQGITNLAVMLHVQGHLAEAEPVYLEGIPMLEAVNGSTHPNVLALKHNFALLRSDQGRYEEAHALLLEVIALAETTFGAEHPSAITFNLKLARNLLRAGRQEEARTHYEKYIPLQEAALGAEHPHVKTLRQEFNAAFS